MGLIPLAAIVGTLLNSIVLALGTWRNGAQVSRRELEEKLKDCEQENQDNRVVINNLRDEKMDLLNRLFKGKKKKHE